MARGGSGRAPAKTRDQRMRALRQANEIRTSRAALKKELASGRVRFEDVLAQPPDWARTAKVSSPARSTADRSCQGRSRPPPLPDRTVEDCWRPDGAPAWRADRTLSTLSSCRGRGGAA